MPYKRPYIPNEYVIQTIVNPQSRKVIPSDLDQIITELLESNGIEVKSIVVNQATRHSYENGVFAFKNTPKSAPETNNYHYS